MKRAFFLLACLWVFCNLCMAQDIYTAGCSLYDVFVKSDPLAVGGESHEKPAIYPNPARESVFIDGLEEGEMIGVFNMEGQLVRSVKADSDRKIDVRGLPSGIYYVRCGYHVMRFVKE